MRRTNDVLVGAVTLAVVLSLTGATLWVKQTDIGERRTRVVARFRDVGNAKVGAPVVIRGVRSGRIDAIELAPDGWVHVRMALERSAALPQNAAVLLNESSLFGEWQAMITPLSGLPRDETVQRQVEQSSGGGDVLPGATLPDIAKLTAVAGQIAGDVANVASRVETAFDDDAARELRQSMRSFALLSSTLARTVQTHAGDLDTLSRGLEGAVASLRRTAAITELLAARVDSSTRAGQVRQIVDDVAGASAELRATSLEIHGMSRRLAQSQEHLERFLTAGDSVLSKINDGRGSLGLFVNDSSLYRHADSVLVQLQSLLGDVKANPKRYFGLRIF